VDRFHASRSGDHKNFSKKEEPKVSGEARMAAEPPGNLASTIFTRAIILSGLSRSDRRKSSGSLPPLRRRMSSPIAS